MTKEKLEKKIKESKEKRSRGRKRTESRGGLRRIIPSVIIAIAVLLTISVGGHFAYKYILVTQQGTQVDDDYSDIVEQIPEGIADNNIVGKGVLEHILLSFRTTEEALAKRPPTIELNNEELRSFVSVDECKIDDGNSQVKIQLSSQGIPASDDKYYYLFELKGYDDSGVLEGLEFIDRTLKKEDVRFNCALRANSPNSRLYSKFAVAVKKDGEYVLAGSPSFVTNPEVLSKRSGRISAKSKKGILIDYNRVHSGQLEDLGVSQAAINIPLNMILGPTTNAFFPTIHYSYNGKSYSFNGVTVAGFDATVSALTKKGIQTTAILLNSYTNAYIDLIHPDARSKGVCPYYMFNGSTDEGVELLAAVSAFLADRYSGSAHGVISNWVIANEINARKEWNYLKYCDVDTYSKEYAKGFRVMYNAIKSTNKDATVMISLDQNWNKNLKNSPDYDGRDVLDCFNSYINEQGNIDWAIAYHPYNVPLTSCKTWSKNKHITHNADTPSISMQNIEVLINYLKAEHYLNPNEECRDIMITELGYTSTGGQELQAAALAYAYYKIDYYDEIKGLLLNRQTDDATEIAQGLATGITTAGGGLKTSYNVFKYMDSEQREKHTEFAKSIIGISDWKETIY